MDKFFKVTNKKLFKEVLEYRENSNKQNEFIKRFFEVNGIDGNEYHIGGDGLCNCEFREHSKDNIRLAILPTESNISRFGNDFKKDFVCERLRSFKKTSKLLKKFQDECIENHIIINLLRVRIGDYFKELHFGGFGTEGLHEFEGAYYLKIHTTKYDTITPAHEGFEEIKGSEYYTVVENMAD